MNAIVKKYFTIFLIFSVFISQSYAIGINDVFNGTSVSTDVGTWASPRTGTKYFYGGSYTFAFKGAGSYQPFFQGESPSAKIGCNGFSLSGGFIALLGIDEIKVLLKNAGATLAWGLMMALNYSMPALAAVFKSLRTWSREIQKLLQNACNVGRMLGTKAFGSTMGKVKTAIDDSAISKGLNSFATQLNHGAAGFDKMIDGWIGDTPSTTSKPCDQYSDIHVKQACLNKKGTTVAGYVLKLAKSNSVSLSSATIGAFAKNGVSSSNDISISKLSNFFSDGKIGSKQILSSGSDQLEQIKVNILIGRLFFGDFATPYDALKRVLDSSNTNIAEGTFPINAKKAKDSVKAAINHQFYDKTNGMVLMPPVITSDKEAAKALLNGITTQTESSKCFAGYCKVQDNYLYYINVALDSNNKEKAILLGNIYRADTSGSANLKVEWDGAYLESLKVIRAIVKNKSGQMPTYKASNEVAVSIKEPTSPSIKIPLLLPNISVYIKDIVLLERKAKKETAYTASLKEIIARYNAYFYATSLADMIAGNVLDAIGARGDIPGDPDIAKFMPYIESIKKRKEAIMAEIKDEQKNQITYTELTEMFKKVNDQIRTDMIKSY